MQVDEGVEGGREGGGGKVKMNNEQTVRSFHVSSILCSYYRKVEGYSGKLMNDESVCHLLKCY